MSARKFKEGDRISVEYLEHYEVGVTVDAGDEIDGSIIYTVSLDSDPGSFYAFDEDELSHYPFTQQQMDKIIGRMILV